LEVCLGCDAGRTQWLESSEQYGCLGCASGKEFVDTTSICVEWCVVCVLFFLN
jgi:hypothetical protein